jgi:hypothetical protein
MLDAGDARVRRLYPSAYADDAEKEDEYRRLTHEELRSSRLANVDKTNAHRNHLHLPLTKAGAAKNTTYSTRRAAT